MAVADGGLFRWLGNPVPRRVGGCKMGIRRIRGQIVAMEPGARRGPGIRMRGVRHGAFANS